MMGTREAILAVLLFGCVSSNPTASSTRPVLSAEEKEEARKRLIMMTEMTERSEKFRDRSKMARSLLDLAAEKLNASSPEDEVNRRVYGFRKLVEEHLQMSVWLRTKLKAVQALEDVEPLSSKYFPKRWTFWEAACLSYVEDWKLIAKDYESRVAALERVRKQ